MMGNPKTFHFVMIAPSHYDDEGYVIQWKVSSIPSNSMASIYGIAQDAIERRPLGPDVEIRLEAFQEANTRIVPEEIAARLQGPNSRIFVALFNRQQRPVAIPIDGLGVPFDLPLATLERHGGLGFRLSGRLQLFLHLLNQNRKDKFRILDSAKKSLDPPDGDTV